MFIIVSRGGMKIIAAIKHKPVFTHKRDETGGLKIRWQAFRLFNS